MRKIELVCIIDDDPIFVYATKKLMQFIDFCNEYIIFQNGEEALDYLKPLIEEGKKIPEIILLDLNMPVMDGWQFLDAFTKIPVNTKITIYIVSSSNDSADLEKAKDYENIDNYIVKPVTPDMLQTILQDFRSASI